MPRSEQLPSNVHPSWQPPSAIVSTSMALTDGIVALSRSPRSWQPTGTAATQPQHVALASKHTIKLVRISPKSPSPIRSRSRSSHSFLLEDEYGSGSPYSNATRRDSWREKERSLARPDSSERRSRRGDLTEVLDIVPSSVTGVTWNPTSSSSSSRLPPPTGVAGTVLSDVKWGYEATSNKIAASFTSGSLALFDLTTSSDGSLESAVVQTRKEQHERSINKIAFGSATGSWLVSAGQDGLVRIWDTRNRTPDVILRLSGPVSHVSFCPSPSQPTVLLACLASGILARYDIRRLSPGSGAWSASASSTAGQALDRVVGHIGPVLGMDWRDNVALPPSFYSFPSNFGSSSSFGSAPSGAPNVGAGDPSAAQGPYPNSSSSAFSFSSSTFSLNLADPSASNFYTAAGSSEILEPGLASSSGPSAGGSSYASNPGVQSNPNASSGGWVVTSGTDRTIKIWDFNAPVLSTKPYRVIRTVEPMASVAWNPSQRARGCEVVSAPWSEFGGGEKAPTQEQDAEEAKTEIQVWDIRQEFFPARTASVALPSSATGTGRGHPGSSGVSALAVNSDDSAFVGFKTTGVFSVVDLAPPRSLQEASDRGGYEPTVLEEPGQAEPAVEQGTPEVFESWRNFPRTGIAWNAAQGDLMWVDQDYNPSGNLAFRSGMDGSDEERSRRRLRRTNSGFINGSIEDSPFRPETFLGVAAAFDPDFEASQFVYLAEHYSLGPAASADMPEAEREEGFEAACRHNVSTARAAGRQDAADFWSTVLVWLTEQQPLSGDETSRPSGAQTPANSTGTATAGIVKEDLIEGLQRLTTTLSSVPSSFHRHSIDHSESSQRHLEDFSEESTAGSETDEAHRSLLHARRAKRSGGTVPSSPQVRPHELGGRSNRLRRSRDHESELGGDGGSALADDSSSDDEFDLEGRDEEFRRTGRDKAIKGSALAGRLTSVQLQNEGSKSQSASPNRRAPSRLREAADSESTSSEFDDADPRLDHKVVSSTDSDPADSALDGSSSKAVAKPSRVLSRQLGGPRSRRSSSGTSGSRPPKLIYEAFNNTNGSSGNPGSRRASNDRSSVLFGRRSSSTRSSNAGLTVFHGLVDSPVPTQEELRAEAIRARLDEMIAALRSQIVETLREYADRGDSQLCAVACAILGHKLPELKQSFVLRTTNAYLEQLREVGLHVPAANMLRVCNVFKLKEAAQTHITWHTTCAECSRPLDQTPYGLCRKCSKVAVSCAICHLPALALVIFCVGCGHGCHSECLSNYVDELTAIPSSSFFDQGASEELEARRSLLLVCPFGSCSHSPCMLSKG